MQSRNSSSGVTLLEVLLSMVILGLIGAAMSSMIGTGTRVWDRVGANSAVVDGAVQRLAMRQAMEGLPTVTLSRPLDSILDTQRDGFSFGEDIEANTNFSVKHEDGRLLFHNIANGPPQTAYANIQTVKFNYFGRKNIRETAQWYGDWSEASLLPLLIKIESTQVGGLVNPPITMQPARTARQSEISLSSLVPPD